MFEETFKKSINALITVDLDTRIRQAEEIEKTVSSMIDSQYVDHDKLASLIARHIDKNALMRICHSEQIINNVNSLLVTALKSNDSDAIKKAVASTCDSLDLYIKYRCKK